jgi:hypothetical protein
MKEQAGARAGGRRAGRAVVALATVVGLLGPLQGRQAMAATTIAFRSASSKGTTLGRQIKITKPAGVIPGDLLIAGLYVRGAPSVTAPAGWTLIRQDGSAFSYRRVAGASEPASYTWTYPENHTAAGAIAAYTGVDTSDPVQVTSGRVNGKSVSLTAPSITTTKPGTMVVGVFGVGRKTTINRPSGMKERADVASTNGTKNVTAELSELLLVGPAITGDKVATAGAAGKNAGQLIGLNPILVQSSAFTATALSSSSALLLWNAPAGTARLRIHRDGWLVDDIAAGPTSYTDRLLWPSTTVWYQLEALDAGGGTLLDLAAPVTTPAQVGSFPRLYAATSFWNQPIGANPAIDPNSAAIVAASITPTANIATFNNNNEWGVPLAFSDPASKLYTVGCLYYGCSQQVQFRIPRSAHANTGSDGKLVVIDPGTNTELDMGVASYNGQADSWTTNSRYTTQSDGWGAMCAQGLHCDGVLMSGLDQFGGIVRPEEIAQGHIDHALSLIVPYWRSGFIACPAVKTSGGTNDSKAIPMSARIQLDPTFDVDGQSWPQWKKVIAKALQTYGAYVWDAGSDRLDIRAESNISRGYDAWAKVGVPSQIGQASLAAIPWNQVRVLQITPC